MTQMDVAERATTTSRDLIDALASIVGADAVLTSLEDRRFYSLDFSEEGGAVALAVVRPRTAEHVAAIVKVAGERGVAVNTRGGGMSYTQGARARRARRRSSSTRAGSTA